MPARPAGRDRLRQRGGAADLDHMIDTASIRQVLCLLTPLRHGLVIDDVVGPETLELLQFLLGGRCSDYLRACSFRDCSAKSDTPPVPRISTVSPGFT